MAGFWPRRIFSAVPVTVAPYGTWAPGLLTGNSNKAPRWIVKATLIMLAFLALLAMPGIIFSTYVMAVRRWMFRKQIPYAVAYMLVISLLLGWILGLRLELLLLAIVILGLRGWFELLGERIREYQAIIRRSGKVRKGVIYEKAAPVARILRAASLIKP